MKNIILNTVLAILLLFFVVAGDVHAQCGDLNRDGRYSGTDLIMFVDYIFKGGTAPDPVTDADVNGDGNISSNDLMMLFTHIFKGGPAPFCPLESNRFQFSRLELDETDRGKTLQVAVSAGVLDSLDGWETLVAYDTHVFEPIVADDIRMWDSEACIENYMNPKADADFYDLMLPGRFNVACVNYGYEIPFGGTLPLYAFNVTVRSDADLAQPFDPFEFVRRHQTLTTFMSTYGAAVPLEHPVDDVPFPEQFLRGDVNEDYVIDGLDVTALASIVYRGGSVPDNWERADVSRDDYLSTADIVYLMRYLYEGQPLP